MDENASIAALLALAQPTRLRVFKNLVRQGAEGLPAGEIAAQACVPHNTMSTHLRILTESGLLAVRQVSRERIYAVRFDAMQDLIAFLLEDCCQGRPEICEPLAGILAQPACCP